MTVPAATPLTAVKAQSSESYKSEIDKPKEKGGEAISFKSSAPQVIPTSTASKLTPKEQLTLDLVRDKLGKCLDVEIKNGMLIITANDKKPSNWLKDANDERRMSTIKESLGLKDGTIGKHNPEVYDCMSDSIQRGYGSTPDDGVLAHGCYIEIPVSSVGEAPHIFQIIFGTFEDLKK